MTQLLTVVFSWSLTCLLSDRFHELRWHYHIALLMTRLFIPVSHCCSAVVGRLP
jgi:hypothetical protein